MKRYQLLPFLFIVLACPAFAQESSATGKTGMKKMDLQLHEGLGLEKSFYAELGLALRHRFHDDQWYSNPFAAFEFLPAHGLVEKEIYGVKVGYEIGHRFMVCGVETKYLANNTSDNFIATPKIGVSFGRGVLNIFYGYQLFLNEKRLDALGPHLISISLNIKIR